jgi:cytochrome c biogenesis protein CcmG, thiol:disulfide interchange protein DsbE
MKNIITHIAYLALATCLSSSALAVDVGHAAPDFDLRGLQGAVKLSDYKGKVVYLDFWASWCGPCKQSFPWMNDMQSRYSAKGLNLVAVNVDQKPEDAKTFLNDNAAKFTVAYDQAGKTPKSYAIKGMPTSVLIGADGKVLMVHSGFKDEQRDELERAIKAALNLKD